MHPVVRSGETEVSVYFPGDNTLWYEIETYKVYQGSGYQTIPVAINKVIVIPQLVFHFSVDHLAMRFVRFLYSNEEVLLFLRRNVLDEHHL